MVLAITDRGILLHPGKILYVSQKGQAALIGVAELFPIGKGVDHVYLSLKKDIDRIQIAPASTKTALAGTVLRCIFFHT